MKKASTLKSPSRKNTFYRPSFSLSGFIGGILFSLLIFHYFTSISKGQPTAYYTPKQAPEAIRYPITAPLIERSAYALAYDGRNRNPFWVCETLTKNNLTKNADRKNFKFSADPQVPTIFQSQLEDYSSSGYDRGHMVPAADQSNTADHLKDTFYLSNICPQIPELNRGLWGKLESHIRSLVKIYKTVQVYTGPLYVPKAILHKRFVQYEVIGPNDVAVPTHFFKVIFKYNHDGSIENETFIIPNEVPSKGVSFMDYKRTLVEVERLSGIIFQSIRQ